LPHPPGRRQGLRCPAVPPPNGTDEGAPLSRGLMRRELAERPPEDVWRAVLGWTTTLEPFWSEAIRRFAPVAGLPDDKRDRHLATAEGAFEKMDGWHSGRLKLVKARRQEIDSAISFVWNTALRRELQGLVQAPVARHVGPALRQCLTVSAGGYRPDQLAALAAGLVYTWAECRTLFPGDSNVLLQHIPPEERHVEPGPAGPDHADEHHLLYGTPADRFGLREAADRVCAEAWWIWERFDEPAPWDLPDDLWTRRDDGLYHDMHYADQRAFHERNAR
jgi:hypothetical protein